MTTTAGASKFFPKAQEGFTTTTSGLVASGASTVGLNSTGNYSNGDTVVLIIDPGVVGKEQSFTGVIDTSGVQVTGVVWLSGTNVPHVSGATVVDYVAAGHIGLISAGALVSHNADGTPKAGVTYPTPILTTPTITDFSNADHTHTNNAGGGKLNGTNAITANTIFSTVLGLSNALDSSNGVQFQANAGTAGGTMFYINLGGIKLLWMITAQQNVGIGGATWTVTLPTSFFTTLQYIAPSLYLLGTTPSQTAYISSANTTTVTIGQVSTSNGSTQQTSLLLIGT